MAFTRDGRSKTPTVQALAVEGVTAASFWGGEPGTMEVDRGVIYDVVSGQETFMHKVSFGWIASDDAGRDFFGLTVRHAILKARATNR